MSHDNINKFLSSLVEKSLIELEYSYCIQIGEVWLFYTSSKVRKEELDNLYDGFPFVLKFFECLNTSMVPSFTSYFGIGTSFFDI